MSTDYNIPDHDQQLTSIYERDMVRRAPDEEDPDDEADEPDEDEHVSIPCSKCSQLTSFDPIYGDLCYRCCRADNE